MMALYNFQKRFVPKIESGEKRHTIRAKRVRVTKPGELLHLYTGLRQKGARLLMRTRCTKVQTVVIQRSSLSADVLRIMIDGYVLMRDEAERFARADGFDSLRQMAAFWRSLTPFLGDIIHWNYPPEQWGKDQSVESAGKHVSQEVSVAGVQQPGGRIASEILQHSVPHEGLQGAASEGRGRGALPALR